MFICRECKKQVTPDAEVCPHCGEPLKGDETWLADQFEEAGGHWIFALMTSGVLGLAKLLWGHIAPLLN